LHVEGVERPDVIHGVRDLVLANVRTSGQLHNERITRAQGWRSAGNDA
jgi:hypothetical protein